MKDKQDKKVIDTIIWPCCRETTIKDEFQICKVGGWEHNMVQLDDHDFTDGLIYFL